MPRHEIVGNVHMHTPFSDGEWYHAEIAAAAEAARLDFIVTTDHNVWVNGPEGYHGSVLVLVGEEVHDTQRHPQANHCLIFGADSELCLCAKSPQGLIDAARARNALTFLAHPHDCALRFIGEGGLPWVDWDIEGYTGIELWNYMSEFKARIPNMLMGIWYAFKPRRAARGPLRETLALWDGLLAEGRRVAAIGGSDAHGSTYTLGPIRRTVFPYEYLFRCVNMHVLIDRSLTRDVAANKRLIYAALAKGHCWIGYDLLADTRGFRFAARSMANSAGIGDDLKRAAAVNFEVETPAPGSIRLIRAGKGVVARTNGRALKYTSAEAGVYRVEVLRGGKGWIYSNPIYVR
ncbi:MAG TPA: CehA/McbA family metallohydrolase [Anaerolineae bacterium]